MPLKRCSSLLLIILNFEAIKNNQATYIESGEVKSSWTSLSLASNLGSKIEAVSSVSQSGEFTFA
jgi:hypothetical protein